MTKIIIASILSIISILSFIFFTKPSYEDIKSKQAYLKRINEEIENAKTALSKFDSLAEKYREISAKDRSKLDVMIPVNSVDNIQLILDIEGIANKYDILLEKVDISRAVQASSKGKEPDKNPNSVGINVGVDSKASKIKQLEISFTVKSSYDNFLKFLLDLEHSLRIVDVVELSFNSDSGEEEALSAQNSDIDSLALSEFYNFNVVLRTYWIDDK